MAITNDKERLNHLLRKQRLTELEFHELNSFTYMMMISKDETIRNHPKLLKIAVAIAVKTGNYERSRGIKHTIVRPEDCMLNFGGMVK